MSKLLNYTIKVCVVILVIMNVFYIYYSKNQKHTEMKEQQEQAMKMIDSQNLERELKEKFLYEYSYLPLGLVVEDVKGNKQELIKVLKGNSFVLWYPQHNCSLCFQSSLDQFLDFSRKGGKAIVLSTHLGVRDLFFFKKKYNIDVPCYVVKECTQPYSIEEYINPLFFNLSEDMQISNLWIHNPKSEDIAKEYFKMQERQAQASIK